MKKILTFIFILFAWLIFVNPVWAENFTIENYEVIMNVNKNKSVQITENIDVDFFNASHGIYRNIPFKNASITDISVSERYQTSYSGNNVNIKIGNPDVYVSGKHHYTISYKYNNFDNKNEFYHNIIGNDWDVYIHRAKFKVTMPEKFDSSKAGLSIGKYGTRGFNGGAWFKVDGNVISGATERELLPHEGITLRVEVPDDYFLKYTNFTHYWVIAGMLLLTLIAFLTWFTYGKDDPVTPVVNFYPPKGVNAIEVEMAYKGKASTKGLVALLIELAQKGYVVIESTKKGLVKGFTLHKHHSYDGVNKNEKAFLNALFENGENSVTDSELAMSTTFYKNCEKIIDNINKKRNQIFNPESIGCPLTVLMFLCLAGLLFLTVYSLSGYNFFNIGEYLPLVFMPIIAICVLISGWKSNPIFATIWAIFFGGIPLLGLFAMVYSNISNSVVLTGIIGLVIAGICTYQLPKRSQIGQRLLNNLLGLKHFIEVAEKHRLQQLVNQDPEYFYSVLPSAYVLEVSDKWINQFESIMQINPEWYSGGNFNTHTFHDFTRSMDSVSVPSVANGGVSTSSSGGGGFSGGGHGGGGGGSW